MAPWNRRRFVQASTVTVAAAHVGAMTPQAVGANKMNNSVLVDTHLHCFAGTQVKQFPYHRRAPYRPDEPATPEHLLKCMDDAGVHFAIVVHPEPYQDDHRYLQHCLEAGNGRLKGTCLVFSDRRGSVDQLPRLCEEMDIVAVRVHAYAPDRLPPFGSPELRELWRQATELGMAVQLHFEPRYAPGFAPLIREFSKTKVLIDHMGRPFQGTPQQHAVVMKWSEYPNTVMKISAIPEPRSYPHRDIEPTIKQLTDAFGPDRMMYGGGFNANATGESYAAAFARARELLAHLSRQEQDAILGGTASKLFRFESP